MARKFNLVVQSINHPHGISNVVVDDMIDDLVVQEAYHLHVSSDINGNANIRLNASDLSNLSIIHDHGVSHIFNFPQQQYITVADAAHVLADDFVFVSPHHHLDITGTLPVLEFEGTWGIRLDFGTMNLPGLTFSSRVGSRMSAKLPFLDFDSSVTVGAAGQLDLWLPTLISGDNRFAWRADNIMLPDLQISISITDYLPLRLNKILPGLKLEASGIAPLVVFLNAKLPFLAISASCSVIHTANLDAKLPTLKSITASYGTPATLDEYLPALSISASGTSGDVLTLDCKIPVVVLRAHPTGEAGGGRADPAVLQDVDRFGDDYVLRYQRYG